jgi:hypothetical protein
MMDFKSAICRITVKEALDTYSFGTGFFISDKLILTCNHVIIELDDNENVEFSLKGESKTAYEAKIIAQSEEHDMAVLEILSLDFIPPKILILNPSDIDQNKNLKLFGFPNSGNYNYPSQERITGLEIKNTINHINDDFTEEVKHDLVLDLKTDILVDHAGISGSPLLNEFNEGVAIFKMQADLSCGAVSVKKAEQFLIDNDIVLKKDSHDNFNDYLEKSFIGYEDRKTQCEDEAREVIKLISPQKILNNRKGNLFYPKKDKNLDEIIIELNTSKDVNEQLWKGWVQLLTFVKLLKGDQKDINHIQVTLTRSEIYKKFGFKRKERIITTPMTLNFYFTEKETYSTIVSRYIHGEYRMGNLNTTACHIFDSHQENFGSKIESVNRIIKDISGLENSGPNIYGAQVGVLSLKQLRDKVINSNSLNEVTLNLQKLIEDALS